MLQLKIIVILIIISIFYSQNLFCSDEYEVNVLDNPSPGYLIIDGVSSLIDNYGDYVFEDNLNFGTNSFKLLKNGLYAMGVVNDYYLFDKNLNIVDTIFNKTSYVRDAHDFISLSNGHYLMLCSESIIMDLSKYVDGGSTKANVMSNVLVETDNKGIIYWQWRAIEHTDIKDVADEFDLNQLTIDFTHINSLDEDNDGNILISIRHFDEIALINKSTGDLIWRMGGSKCKNNQFTFVNDTENDFTGFSHQHCASILANGNILLYDNGNLKPTLYSRVVEYKIDVPSKTATKVWEYRYTPDIYNSTFGSAYQMENGNILINFSNGKIVEVKPNGTVAYEINCLLSTVYYRAQKSTLNAIYSKKDITVTGDYDFNDSPNDTGVRLSLTKAEGSSPVYIQKHSYAPPSGEYTDTTALKVLPYRWVITHDNNLNITGTITINTSAISNPAKPEQIKIFQRPKESKGIFQELQTAYNAEKGEISAPFTGYGEFTVGRKEITSVNDNIEDNILKIFPNPVSDNIYIHLNDLEFPAIAKIFDMTGNQVMNIQMENMENKIDVTKLSSGIYFIYIKNRKGLIIKE